MNLYKKAEKSLLEKYNIDLLEQIVLARNDRAVYYVEFINSKIIFTKIHGKSPLDFSKQGDSFTFDYVEQVFDIDSKYGEVAGKEYYKNTNLNAIKYMEHEANISIPLLINHQRFWVRFHLYTTLHDDNGKPTLASCYITDVTKYLVHEEALYEKTHKDELTKLYNRYALSYHFEIRGDNIPVLGFYFDIDNFKKYNDTYGHDIGDQVLVKLSENLLKLTNEKFNVYRLGGDEFFVLVFNTNQAQIQKYTDLINDCIANIEIPTIDEVLSLSIGCVYTHGDIRYKSELFIKEADRLMYVSKRKGKSTITVGEFVVF